MATVQQVILVLLWICLLSLIIYFFPVADPLLWITILLLLCYFIFIAVFARRRRSFSVLFSSCSTVLAINLALNVWLYPQLVKYQSGSNIAWFLQDEKIDLNTVKTLNYDPNSLEFYSGRWMDTTNASQLKSEAASTSYFIGRNDLLQLLNKEDVSYRIIYTTPDYAITRLSFSFLFPSTRDSSSSNVYVVKVD
jgi:hypothetical protein